MNPVSSSPKTVARRFPATPRRIACAVALACLPLAAQALDIAQVPLVAGGSAAANIMYIHDDSGSMTSAIVSNNDPGMFNANVRYELPLDHTGNPLPNAPHPKIWGTSSDASDGYSCYNATCQSNYSITASGWNSKYSVLDAAGKQNFANWYAYYRTKNLAAKAAISRAFKDLPGNVRLGWGRINNNSTNGIDGVTVNRLERGVRPYSSVKQNFYQWLFGIRPSGETPLRMTLEQVGKYFDRSAGGNLGPWADDPATGEGTSGLACRKSFTILMTDGEWNELDSDVTVGNEDNVSSFSTPPKPDGTHEIWSTAPFKDSYSKTLGDIAWKYWARDLAPGNDNNRVVGTQRDPAWWQHMTTFTIGFGVKGTMDKATAFDHADNYQTNTWPNVTTDHGKIDDLLHAAVNGHGDNFMASNAQEFVDSLEAIFSQVAVSIDAIAPVAASSTTLRSDSKLFQATFNGKDWSGDLQAYALDSAGNVASTPQWSASLPVHDSRSLFTWRPDTQQGAPFSWSGLSAAQQGILGSQAMLDYLRGAPANVTPNGLKYRHRAPLGDIINSAPLFVDKATNFGYGTSSFISSTDRAAYQNRRTNATRSNMVYVGANDGMLHAFDADVGAERFAYVPNGVFANLPALANPNYAHRYYVDGSPAAGDVLFPSGDWHTVLVGSTGAGGKSYFALDVENPDSFNATSVLWEIDDNTPGFKNLGVTLGQATLTLANDGNWVAIFANGYNSGDDGSGNAERAQLFIVSAKTGALLKRIDTGAGSENGLSTPLVIDIDQNGTADYVYAGDIRGNLWKFDISGNDSSAWKVALSGQPLLVAKDSSGWEQPITAKPQAGRHPNGVMIYVGTGKFLETSDHADKSIQTLYGVLDNDSLSGTQRSDLVAQTITEDDTEQYRFVSSNPVNYTGGSAKHGFYIDLVPTGKSANGERLIAAPVVWSDRVIFNTLIPSGTGGNACVGGGVDGWLLEVDPFSGSRTAESVFDINGDGLFNSGDFVDGKVVSGTRVGNGTGFSAIKAKDKIIKSISTAKGTDGITQIANRPIPAGRQSWMQIR
jgi:type IV pilus assembly protein PilY1